MSLCCVFHWGRKKWERCLGPVVTVRGNHLSVLYLWGGEEVGRSWCSIITYLETIVSLFFGMKHWCVCGQVNWRWHALHIWTQAWVMLLSRGMLMIWVCDLSASRESKKRKENDSDSFLVFFFSGWLDPFFKFCWFSHLRTEQGVDTG